MIPADGRSGSTVGKYRLHEIVGRGGMGVVYRAEHVYIGREVAVKILHEGYGGRDESIKRFLREARAASLINHPNIVEVTDFGKANDGTVFFVMELLVGEPLDNILARDHRLDLLRSITICNQLAAALAAAHSKGIIHRDLKPENVMLIPREGRRELVRRVADQDGDRELSERETRFDFVKILDFGVAKVREPEVPKGRVTQAGVVFGTPEYMAPETARVGYSDARSDIYALGVMFYEMLTGTVPFTGDTPVEVMMKQVNERVPPMLQVTPNAEITPDSERMILKALAKDPEHRQQSMEEFHRDLQKCYGQLRFRRTVRTPTVNTPAITTIALTKKKQPPGSIPTGTPTDNSVSIEIDARGTRTRFATPTLAGLSSASAPILLTKKKARQTPVVPMTAEELAGESDPAALQDTPPPVAPLSHDTRQAQKPEKQKPEKKKRTTLPLGLDQNVAAAAVSWAPTANKPPQTPPIPVRGVDIGSVMIRVPPQRQAAIAGSGPLYPDRPTPRVAVGTRDSDERSWLDEPTAPGVKIGGG